jgi:AbrB family looped-hinge helix DNA binding protein
MITKVTGKNQVTIPAKIAAAEGIQPGTRLDWESTDEENVLRVLILPDPATLAAELRGRGSTYKRSGSDPVANLIRERAESESGD